MVWNIILPAVANWAMGEIGKNSFRPKDNSSKYINEYMEKMKALKPDYAMALQDPAVQALEKGGIKAGQMAQQRALNQLISQGFKGSTLAPQIQAQAGTTAKQPYLQQSTQMQSEIANRDYQQQAEGLKMLLQSRLGLAQQQQQHDTGMGMLGMQGVLSALQGQDWSKAFDWLKPATNNIQLSGYNGSRTA